MNESHREGASTSRLRRTVRRFRWTLGAMAVLLVAGGWWATRGPSLAGTGLEWAWSSQELIPIGNAGGGLLMAVRLMGRNSPPELVAVDWRSGGVVQTIRSGAFPEMVSPLGEGAVVASSFPGAAADVRYWPGPGQSLQPLANVSVTGDDYRRLAPPDDPGLAALKVSEPRTLLLAIGRNGEDRLVTLATIATTPLQSPGVITRIRVSGRPPAAGEMTQEYVSNVEKAAQQLADLGPSQLVPAVPPLRDTGSEYGIPAEEWDVITFRGTAPGSAMALDHEWRPGVGAVAVEEHRSGSSAVGEALLRLSGRQRVVSLGVYTRPGAAGERRTAFYRGGPLTPGNVGGRFAQLDRVYLSEDGRFVGLSVMTTSPMVGGTAMAVYHVTGRETR